MFVSGTCAIDDLPLGVEIFEGFGASDFKSASRSDPKDASLEGFFAYSEVVFC
jgi:hypothetical protein